MSSSTAAQGWMHRSPEIASALESPEVRVEGPLKVAGQARYTADLLLPGMLWAEFLLSPVPHARIVSIDTSAAKALPGVHAVLAGADIGLRRFGRQLCDWPVLAHEQVWYVGERVAAVAAESPELAEAAIGLIEVQYEELPAVFDPEAALAEGAPILHPDPSGYYYWAGQRPPRPHLNLQGYHLDQKGDLDIERAFAQADRVFEDVYTAPRQHQGYLEPHACVVWIGSDGLVRVRTTNKAPFGLRRQLALVSGLPEERIEVDSRFIGADFGGKGNSIEDFACYFLAQASGRPVKALMSYADELLSANPRHSARFYLRTGVARVGRIVAHQTRAYFNGGAYGGAKPAHGLLLPGWDALEVYNIPNTRLETFVVYTNTVPSGNMRAPGAAQLALAGEGHVEHIARSLGMDPLEFRLLNALREGDTSPAGHPVRNPRAVAVLEALRRETNWGQRALPPNHGRGIALRSRHVGQGKTEIAFHLLPDGRIEALYGTPDQGSGSATLVRRIASAVLSVPLERVVVRYGTTAEAPWDAGAGASRVTHVVGRAALAATTRLKEKLLELAAEVMGWPAGQVRLEQDHFLTGDGAQEKVPFEVVAQRILRSGPVEAGAAYDSSGHSPDEPGDFNFHAYMVEVEVDPETGQVRPIEAVVAVDVGAIINPIAHQGQIDGSFVYGLGNALMEELVVEDGKVITISLADYKLPSQEDVVPLRTVLVPTEIGPGPFGAKAAGESVNAGVSPAIANAIYDAVGARVKTLPLTAERVLQAIRAARG
ncbi:MAG: xanthine dehydrogenase family protein molybdopterin-binding subunit [Chloroflexi bacterium]|nr:xanthine dehydrogenase family protein molybdopterin-binding subunit [Chloroflexota bacterium]